MKRIFIDVREPYEFTSGHVAGAINIPPSKMMSDDDALKDIPKDTELVLYCASGNRSNASISLLKTKGYTNLVNGINKDHIKSTYGV